MTNELARASLDFGRLLAEADADGGEAVDWDMFGKPITNGSVLMHGAYGPATRRLLNLVVERYAGRSDVAFGRKELLELAPEAFGQAVDHDFGGNVMHDYGLVLKEEYGYGAMTLKLAQLALARHPEFCSTPG